MLLVTVLTLLTVAAAIPSPNSTYDELVILSDEDYENIDLTPFPKATKLPAGFKYIFVEAQGVVSHTRGAIGTQIEIAGSPLSSEAGLQRAAEIVVKMSKYMPSSIFKGMATYTSLGVFTRAEKVIVFPEFKHLANGDCGSSCTGSCKHTCTFDGRKYEDVGGLGGRRGVANEDNVLCTANDPHRHKHNTMAHEYTHTIHRYALDSATKAKIMQAYTAAKSKVTWTLNSYTMANEREYLAVGATVFFAVNTYGVSTFGGMNMCGSGFCYDEMAGREHLKTYDRALYDVLSYIFTNNRPTLRSGLTTCPSNVVVG